MKCVGETRAHVDVCLKDEDGQVQTLCASFGGGREGNRGGGIIIINDSGGALGTHDELVTRTESNNSQKPKQRHSGGDPCFERRFKRRKDKNRKNRQNEDPRVFFLLFLFVVLTRAGESANNRREVV